MSSCNNNCSTCNSSCSVLCPLCNGKTRFVELETVKSLVIDKSYLLEDEKSFICLNRKCPVIYFQEGNPKYFIKNDVKTQIWFKSSLKEYIVCYCHNIKLLDIVEIVKNSDDDDLNKEKIFKLLGIEKEGDCLHNNPLGESCDKIFDGAIDYAYKQKYDVD